MESEISLNKELGLLKELLTLESVPLDKDLIEQINYIFDNLSSKTKSEVWSEIKIQPIIMRLMLLMDTKNFNSTSYYTEFLPKMNTLVTNFVEKSSIANKFFAQLKLFFSKKKFTKFSKLLTFLSKFKLAQESFSESIEKEVLKDVEGLEKKQEYLTNGVSNYISKNFISEKINPFFQKILRKSMKNISKIRNWMKKLNPNNFNENSEVYYLALILDSNLPDAINKEEALQKEFFNITELVFTNFANKFSADEKIEKAAVKFISNMNSKLKSKRVDSLMINLSEILCLIKGYQSEKIIKEVIDGHFIVMNNVKGEEEKILVTKGFNKLLTIDNFDGLLKLLVPFLNDKKNVKQAGEIILAVTEKINLNNLNIIKFNKNIVYKYNNKIFENINSLHKYFSELWNSFKNICGEAALKNFNSNPDTVPVTLGNVSHLIFNAYFSLINQTEIKNISETNDLEDTQINICRISNYESSDKIINILFKSHSLMFRKSFIEDLNDIDCLLLLKIIYFLEGKLIEHVNKNNIQTDFELLLHSLYNKVLFSKYSHKLFLRGKIKKILLKLNNYSKLNSFTDMISKNANSLIFTTNLISDKLTSLLIEASFIHLTGKLYYLENHMGFKKLLSLFYQEGKNIFEISRTYKSFIKSDFNTKIQLMVLMSIEEFDNESIISLKQYKKVFEVKNEKFEKILDASTLNTSRIFSHNNSSILLGDLNELFDNKKEEKLDPLLNRLCTNLCLFESNYTIKTFCRNLLSYIIIHDSPLVMQRFVWLLSDNNLSKLNRMKKILNLIEMKDLEFEKEEQNTKEEISVHIHFALSSLGNINSSYDYLKSYGYSELISLNEISKNKNYPDVETLEDEREDLFEKCAELHNYENEEEEMTELELNSEKGSIINKYEFIVDSLNSLMKKLVKRSSLLNKSDIKIFSESFIPIQESVKTIIENENNYLHSSLENLFLNILSLTCLQNNVAEILSHYFNILTGNEDSIFMVKVEKTAENLKIENSFFSEHLFQIFYRVLEFVVEFNLSAQAKKNLLEIAVAFTKHFIKYSDKVFKYICNNLNNFYFDFAFETIENELVKNLNKTEGFNHFDVLLNNIIMYEEYAREQVLKIILKNSETIDNSYKLEVSPLNKIKMLFLSQDEDSNVIQYAEKIVKMKVLEFNIESFAQLSFNSMLVEFPKDTHETFAKIFRDLYNKLAESEKKQFLNKISDSLESLAGSQDQFDFVKKDFENRLMLLPKIIYWINKEFKGLLFLRLFKIFNDIEKKKLTLLTSKCLELGQEMIANNPSDLGSLIISQLQQIDANTPLLTPIVFVAECSRINPNLAAQVKDLEKDLERLLDVQDKEFLTSLAKNLRHLMTFIKKPEEMLNKLYDSILKNNANKQINGRSYFIAGLLKGLGIRYFKSFNIIEKMEKVFSASVKKDYKDINEEIRYGCVCITEALWDVFDRLMEPSIKNLMNFLLKFLGDKSERIRDLTMIVNNKIMNRISEFGIKQIVPVIMKGTQEKNSKAKYNAILALGSIANCGTKQLSQNLPLIVPQLTEATNDTNDLVNSAARKSLSMILETIRSPEISQMRDILIKSLSDPFNNNDRSLEALLKTTFKHALDGASLSLIVPVALYGCKPITKDNSKIKSAQLIATMIKLVPKAEEFLPHLNPLLKALFTNLKSVSSEVRAVTAKAFGALSLKFKNETGMKLLNELKGNLENEKLNSTERTGCAQAFGEVMNSLGEEVTSIFVPKALELTKDSREYIRESFLSMFVYLPMIMKKGFVKHIKSTIETVVESISHETEKIRNLAIKSLKIIIQNYLQDDFQVLLKPLFEGSLSENINKKNSSLILLGDIIQMLMDDEKLTKEIIYENYSRIFSLFYIIKNDENSEVRETAKNIYKTFIPNTQTCLRIIFKDLHECFIELFSREQEVVQILAKNGLKEFGNKFSDSFAIQMLELSSSILETRQKRYFEIKKNPEWKSENTLKREISKIETLLSGQSKFISEFISNCNNYALKKIKNSGIIEINNKLCDFSKKRVWMAAFEGLKMFAERENECSIIKNKLTEYSIALNEIEINNQVEDKEDYYEKMKTLFSILFQSDKENVVKEASSFIFDNNFTSWKFEVITQNVKSFGDLLYVSDPLKNGLDAFFNSYEKVLYDTDMNKNKKNEFLENNKFTINSLSINVNSSEVNALIYEFYKRLESYTNTNNTEMIIVVLDSLKFFFERYVIEDINFPYNLCNLTLTLIAYSGDDKEKIYLLTGEFLEVLFRYFDQDNCNEIMDEIFSTLQNIVENNKEYEGLKNQKVVQCLFNLINVVLNYSTLDTGMTALKTSKFLVKELSLELLEPHKKEFYASILRLWLYKYSSRHAETEVSIKKLFSFLNLMLEKKLDMGFLRIQFINYLIMMINSEKKKSLKETEQKKEEAENQEETTNVEPLIRVYMKYFMNINLYFDSLIQSVSNWRRRVTHDSNYYEPKALDEFVEVLKEQPESLISKDLIEKVSKVSHK